MEEAVFNSDVLYLKDLIGKTVTVETVDGNIHTGVVYVVDPVFKTLVLINKDSNRLEFILHHALKSFTVLPEARKEEFLVENTSNGYSAEDLEQRRLKLVKWLKHMFLDVKEDGDLLRVEDHLVIGPPYGKTECLCDNTIVLERIRNIIDVMPVDFK